MKVKADKMKLQFNLTDSRYDLERFGSRKELEELLQGFNGIELMHLESDSRCIISNEMVTGYHMNIPEYWMDFLRGDMERCVREFDSPEKVYRYYGGDSKDALIRKIRDEYNNAIKYNAEYTVIHVSDAAIFEEITGQYHYTDEEVITGFCSMVNEALEGTQSDNAPWLLMENLWQPGLNFRNPEMTRLLMDNINYPKKGIMLDTGHLMHTDLNLKTQKQAAEYVNQKLDEHGELCRYIKGIHLNQSITGAAMKRYMKHPPEPAATYEERTGQLFSYIFSIDLHRPFVSEGVPDLVKRIAPEYMTFEFISNNLEEHKKMLGRQRRVFGEGNLN